jgi:predicted Zn-dependent peptidase
MLVGFAQRMYEPSRLIVGLSGRVDDALLARAAELVGGLEGTRAPDPPPAPAPNGGSRVILDTKPIEQVQLCLGVRAYPELHPDHYAVRLLSTVLGGGMSSRLTEELTMRRGLAYSVYTVALSHSDAGELYAQGGVNVDKVDEAIGVIVDELRRMAEEPVPSDELEKARNYSKGRFVFSTETPQGLIIHGLFDEVLTREVREPDEVLDAMDAVTADDIQRVAGDLLTGGLYLSLVGPFDDPDRFERLIAL